MKLPGYLFFSVIFLLNACSEKKDLSKHQHLGTIKAFAEMVAADVKPIALSEPLSTNEVDDLWAEALAMAKKYQVEIYREKDLVKTDLFPEGLTEGKEVLILHKKEALAAYLNLKKSIQSGTNKQEAARSFGRLLGYPNHHINKLLAEHSSFRTLIDFGVEGTNLFLYYKDLETARSFYHETLGLEILSDYGFAVTLKIAKEAWVTLVDAEIGRHKADEPKAVAIALLTNHLAEWYAYLQDKKVPIKYEYKPKENNPHDGFVAIDPEGYLLEFEMFKPHPENEKLIPKLPKYDGSSSATGKWSIKEGFFGSVTWLYYQDMKESEKFYEETIGLKQIVDQGWAKVYQVSASGYIGLVDEKRGMHNFTEKKGASISFLVHDLNGWYEYMKTYEPFPIIKEMYSGKEERYKAFVGIDPGKYFLEFNRFLPHPDNDKLFQSIQK